MVRAGRQLADIFEEEEEKNDCNLFMYYFLRRKMIVTCCGPLDKLPLAMKHLFEFLVVFRHTVTGAGLGRNGSGAGCKDTRRIGRLAGRFRSLRGGSGQNFSNSSGEGEIIAGADWERRKSFNPRMTLACFR